MKGIIEDLQTRIAELEAKVRSLEARPNAVHHHWTQPCLLPHYPQPPVFVPYIQTPQPLWPPHIVTIRAGDMNSAGTTIQMGIDVKADAGSHGPAAAFRPRSTSPAATKQKERDLP